MMEGVGGTAEGVPGGDELAGAGGGEVTAALDEDLGSGPAVTGMR
jgi:hypothetical protein